MKSTNNRLVRVDFLKTTAALPLVSGAAGGSSSTPTKRDNAVVRENRRPGTVEWQLQYTRFDNPITLVSYPPVRRFRSSAMEGYASRTSFLPREFLDLIVSMTEAGESTLDIYSMGYYGGAGGRRMPKATE